MRYLMLFTFSMILANLLPSVFALQKYPEKASPFDAIRWVNQQPEVQIGKEWYRPLTIDGVQIEKIIQKCNQRWPGQLQKRFSEDLMELMALMGHSPGNTVSLRLIPIGNSSEVVLEGIPNTRNKRQKLWEANKSSTRKPSSPPESIRKPVPGWLSKEQALEDIETFTTALNDQFAYLQLREIDLRKSLKQEIRRQYSKGFTDRVPPSDLLVILQRTLTQFGDGHASVRSDYFRPGEMKPFLPFLLSESDGKVVAYHSNRKGLLHPEFPYLLSIDGRPIEDCIADVTPYITAGSPQLVRRRALGSLRSLMMWRRIETSDFGDVDVMMRTALPVVLTSRDGKKTHAMNTTPTDRKPTYREWPRTASRLLDDNLGYLRLSRMNNDATEEVYRWMPRFRDTGGLIIDVRGNGGGSRSALLALAGFLVGEGPHEGPWVGNFAVYRKSSKFKDDHLALRFMQRLDSKEWTSKQRSVIRKTFARFKPEWKVPDGFSKWHALLLDRTDHPQEYHYTKKVVILSDAGCFSATDIFLGALKIHPRVTLMGTASSGGSARSMSFGLPHSQIEVRCASMASFRPNGMLYDGRGVEVDIEVQPDPTFYIDGGQDKTLERARQWLKE